MLLNRPSSSAVWASIFVLVQAKYTIVDDYTPLNFLDDFTFFTVCVQVHGLRVEV